MVLLAACTGSACSDSILAAEPAPGSGVVQVQGTYCPPSQMPYAPYVPAPAYPYMMPPGSPYMPPRPGQPMQPTPRQPSQTPGQQPQQQTPQQQQPSQTPQQPQQQQQQQPNLARPTFTPPASAPTTAASSPQSLTPNTIGDFFGGSTPPPSILPGNVVNIAILRQPGGAMLDYYRAVTPAGFGNFDTANEVYLGVDGMGQPQSVVMTSPPQLLDEFDGAMFTGDPVDLGANLGGPFLALPSGMTGDVNLQFPEGPGLLVNEPIFNIHDALLVVVPNPGGGGVVGRQKIAEGNTVVPQDRVFLNYSSFIGVPLTASGIDVERFVPGFERTFFGGNMSLEVRVPFATTLSGDIVADGNLDTESVELGNVTTTMKVVLVRTPGWLLGAGVSLAAPTAPNVNVRLTDGTPLVHLQNESLHVMPYIGAAFNPAGRFFGQWYIQGDIGANPNDVRVLDTSTGMLADAGKLDDAAFLYASFSMGYWLYRAEPVVGRWDAGNQVYRSIEYTGQHFFTGFAPLFELHYNRSLESSDTVAAGPIVLENFEHFSLTNMVLGAVATFGTGGSITAAWATPIIGEDDKQFEHEARIILEWRH
ncbi:hypothetical protein Mal4_11460 [Maioricimonas rarisocia]|uniref:Uncharacterized protein n=2 Tax=Maioricimonas rarisocia TaxID=2528026 RepID=A0A517Z324_9PLAN|nr:hypothetical protein Mal4_11460 [Maioricimonas rarisocia]